MTGGLFVGVINIFDYHEWGEKIESDRANID